MNRMKIILGFLLLLGFRLSAQNGTTILINGTLHIGNGKLIENGVLVIEQGKIVQVGAELTTVYKTAKVIDAKGKHLYPGLICMNNFMGLNEVDAVRATHDYSEQGQFNPNVRSLVAYNTDSKILPTALYNGILYTQVIPVGGIISGSSSLMKTKGWNWEDAQVKADEGIHLNWPVILPNKEDQENAGEKQLQQLEKFFSDAQQYAGQNKPVFNARLEAMRSVLSGERLVYIHAQDARSIVRSIGFFKQNYPLVKCVLVGAQDAHLVLDFIKESGVPVVLGNIHRLPGRNADAIDQPYLLPAQLHQAGIKMALSQEGSWETRNLAYLAGTASAYGLGREEALRAITLTPAELMGVDKQIGSLEVGKDASFLISEGDLLDMKSSALFKVYLNGEEVDLKNDQVKLYEKYLKKYHLD